jgi:predicted dehydrogenase
MEDKQITEVGIIMNGVTGRMGTRQHLLRSLSPIIQAGGVQTRSGKTIKPRLLLVGRNEEKLKSLCEQTGAEAYETSLDRALSRPEFTVYFDAQVTGLRFESVKKAIEAGKHIYCEKPTGTNLREALDLWKLARDKGVKNGVVQDKLWLPGLLKLQELIRSGFFGKILSIRGEFGYWVFEGHTVPPNRPSWNYRKDEGGGIIMDMLCHWRYVLDNIFGKVKTVSCLGATHIKERIDESGQPYVCTADDSAYATFELEGDIVAHFNSSWDVRVRRDDLLVLQVDGSRGTAVAGLRDCYTQSYEETPVPVWNPDIPQPIRFFDQWKTFQPEAVFDNAFKVQWELFLEHLVDDSPFPWDLLEGAKGVQLAELGLASWAERRWLSVEPLI